MVTPIGQNAVTSLGRRHFMTDLVDNVYGDNLMFYRLNAANKKQTEGGFQIEVPLIYRRFTNGGPVRGFATYDTAPNDNIKNAAFEWKGYVVPISVDRQTLYKCETSDAVANFLEAYFKQAEEEMSELLGFGIWHTGTDADEIDGIPTAVDASNPPAAVGNYGGIDRATNTWWVATEDGSTATMTLPALQTMFGIVKVGGRRTTIIVGQQVQFDRYWNLNVQNQTIMQGPMAYDQQLAAAGFDNLLFNGVPFAVDDHVDAANNLYFLNEDYFTLKVISKSDFILTDFIRSQNARSYVATVEWDGNLVIDSPARQGKFTALAA